MNVKNMTKSFYKCGVARKYSKSNAQSAKAVTFAGGNCVPHGGLLRVFADPGVGPGVHGKSAFAFVRMTDWDGESV